MKLEIQNKQDTMNIAGTMLNICAILSSMKKYTINIVNYIFLDINKLSHTHKVAFNEQIKSFFSFRISLYNQIVAQNNKIKDLLTLGMFTQQW